MLSFGGFAPLRCNVFVPWRGRRFDDAEREYSRSEQPHEGVQMGSAPGVRSHAVTDGSNANLIVANIRKIDGRTLPL
jgi:hypothetical protein